MRFRKQPPIVCLLAALGLLAAAEIDPRQYLEHVKYLASDELRGRGDGTPELDKAAQYIAHQFRALGLRPVEGRNWFQPFQVTKDARLGKRNGLAYASASGRIKLKPEEEFRPLSFSASGQLSGEVVFAGYGITAEEYHYDDYAGVDVKDKLVLILRHEPQEFDEKSVFGGRIFTNHAQFDSKAVNAKAHGARGVIFVNDRHNHRGAADELEKFPGPAGPAGPGIPFVQVKVEVADRWLATAGKKLDDLAEAIDKDLKPESFALPGSLRVDLTVDVEREMRTVRNVSAYLPGEIPEYVIIGAHYDHLGLGEQFSMAPSLVGTPHPGADDNASGTAGVLELARWFAQQPKRKRGILFLAFAGEELGLLGSNYYVNHPKLPLDKAAAMINLDMIGRVREGKIHIGGARTSAGFQVLLESLNGNPKLNLDFSDSDGYGSTDHYSFIPKQIPVLFFFSGLHGDYHRPSDTWDKIDAAAAVRLLELVAKVSERLLEASERPGFVHPPEPVAH